MKKQNNPHPNMHRLVGNPAWLSQLQMITHSDDAAIKETIINMCHLVRQAFFVQHDVQLGLFWFCIASAI